MVFERFKGKKEEKKFPFTNSAENAFLFNKATECLQENSNDEAIELFEKILETEPDNVHALNGKGSALMQSGRIDEAEEIFNQSLRIKDSEMAYLNKAIINANTGNHEEAIKYCDKVIEMYPHLKDVAQGLKNQLIDNINENNSSNLEGYNDKARELINKGDEFKGKNKIWDAWEAYEEAIEADSDCKNMVQSYINELKSKLIQEFFFFDVTQKDNFSSQNELCMLKLNVMKHILLDNDFTLALGSTNKILTLKEDDIDAINYMGAISFYFDEIDEAIEHFEKVAEKGDGVYLFFADFNRALVLRRKTMVTRDTEYMIQALDIFDEMLKDPAAYDKVKPHQREILDKLQEIMRVPLF